MCSVETALPLLEGDLEQPLILNTENSCSDANDYDKKFICTSAVGCWGQRLSTSWQFINGFLLGFIIQTVSLGSTAIIAIYYGASEIEYPIRWMSKTYESFFVVFFLLSQSWWLLFPVICIAIDSGLTGSQGRGILQKYLLRSNPSDSNSTAQISQREIFLSAIRFHVGIIFGCFVVWSAIDLCFGASLRDFTAVVGSLLACLGLCYGMVIIYDRFIIDEEQEETQKSLEEI
jgi:hypothetical protein